jgi:phospholipid/cholesterol/gamma-HCH transport system substrate-binding protein
MFRNATSSSAPWFWMPMWPEVRLRTGSAFVKSFNVFLTYPFVDEVVGRDPQVARNLHMGDYTNLTMDIDLNLNKIPGVCFPLDSIPPLGEVPPLGALCQDVQDAVQECIDDLNTNFGVKQCIAGLLKNVLDLADSVICGLIKSACKNGHLLGNLDDLLDNLLGGLTGGLLSGHSGPSNGNGNGNNNGGLGGLLDQLTGGLGLGRAPFGELSPSDRGRAYGAMMGRHDRALVKLLMTPMVVGR